MKQMGVLMTSLLERKSKPRVRLSADFAFSTFWLLPHLPLLRSELGEEIEIQILASQVPADPYTDDCDINIHVGPLNKIVDGEIMLMREKVVAVCSPEFLQNNPVKSANDLLELQLLSLSKPPSAEWQTWYGWFEALGIEGERSRSYNSFNNYDMVVQAAIAGQGVALGWLGLVDELLKDGSLIQITGDVVTSQSGYIMSKAHPSGVRGPNLIYDWIAKRCGVVSE